MSQKNIIITLIVVVLVLVGIWLVYSYQRGEGIAIFPGIKLATAGDAGYGWSVKDTEKEAVQEAVAMMKKQMTDKSLKYILFFMRPGSKDKPGYDPEKILAELKSAVGPNVKIHGNTSAVEVLNREGVHSGDVGVITLLGISSDKIKFGVGSANVDDYSSPEEAGKAAILAAMEDAGEKGLPQLIYSALSWGTESRIIEGIEAVVGKNVPMFGGTSGDNDFTAKWNQFTADKIYKNGVVLTVFYTDLKIGYAFDHGYLRSEYKGVVTKSDNKEKSTIYEIDNRPAFDVYNEWTRGLIGSGITLVTHQDAIFFPLVRTIYDEQKNPYRVSSAIIGTSKEEGTLNIGMTVKTGDEIALAHGSWEMLINRAQSTTRDALESKKIDKKDILFGIYTFCGGTMGAVPVEEKPKIPLLIKSELGTAPFIGIITWGEQVFMPGATAEPGVGIEHVTLVNSMVVFSK